MAARVQFTSGFSRRYTTGGVREFTVEAKNLRGVIKEMDRLYPPASASISKKKPPSRSTARSTRPPISSPIREGCEIFFIPKLEGG